VLALPAKINFEIDICRIKIQLVELDFSNWICQKNPELYKVNYDFVVRLPLTLVVNNLAAFEAESLFSLLFY
jgi:predicted ATP-grasp superfamily ATP-dependent carboligase